MGKTAWIIPILVAISAFGGLSVHVMASSRMLFVGARNGHFPTFLSHLNIKTFTPLWSLLFLVSIQAYNILKYFRNILHYSIGNACANKGCIEYGRGWFNFLRVLGQLGRKHSIAGIHSRSLA